MRNSVKLNNNKWRNVQFSKVVFTNISVRQSVLEGVVFSECDPVECVFADSKADIVLRSASAKKWHLARSKTSLTLDKASCEEIVAEDCELHIRGDGQLDRLRATRSSLEASGPDMSICESELISCDARVSNETVIFRDGRFDSTILDLHCGATFRKCVFRGGVFEASECGRVACYDCQLKSVSVQTDFWKAGSVAQIVNSVFEDCCVLCLPVLVNLVKKTVFRKCRGLLVVWEEGPWEREAKGKGYVEVAEQLLAVSAKEFLDAKGLQTHLVEEIQRRCDTPVTDGIKAAIKRSPKQPQDITSDLLT